GSNSYGPTPYPFRTDLNDDPYSSTTNIHYTTNGNDVSAGVSGGLVPIGNGNDISLIHHHYASSSSMAQHNHVSMHPSNHHHPHQTYPHDSLDNLIHPDNYTTNSCVQNIQPYPHNQAITNNNNRQTNKHQTTSGMDYWHCDSQPVPHSSSSSIPPLPPPPSPHYYSTNVVNNNKTMTTNSNHWSRSSPSNNSTPSPIQPISTSTSSSTTKCPPPLPPPSSDSSSSSSPSSSSS
ncbi:hypothetical protein BLA29_009652, partial [Euroglyphus maynei]